MPELTVHDGVREQQIRPRHVIAEGLLPSAGKREPNGEDGRVAARQLSTFRMTRSGVGRHSRSRIGTA